MCDSQPRPQTLVADIAPCLVALPPHSQSRAKEVKQLEQQANAFQQEMTKLTKSIKMLEAED